VFLRYLKSYHDNEMLNTTHGFNVQDECKKIKGLSRIAAQVIEFLPPLAPVAQRFTLDSSSMNQGQSAPQRQRSVPYLSRNSSPSGLLSDAKRQRSTRVYLCMEVPLEVMDVMMPFFTWFQCLFQEIEPNGSGGIWEIFSGWHQHRTERPNPEPLGQRFGG
jgi:hypothetical protein